MTLPPSHTHAYAECTEACKQTNKQKKGQDAYKRNRMSVYASMRVDCGIRRCSKRRHHSLGKMILSKSAPRWDLSTEKLQDYMLKRDRRELRTIWCSEQYLWRAPHIGMRSMTRCNSWVEIRWHSHSGTIICLKKTDQFKQNQRCS